MNTDQTREALRQDRYDIDDADFLAALAKHEAAVRAEALRDMAAFFQLAADVGAGERDLIAAQACIDRAASIEQEAWS